MSYGEMIAMGDLFETPEEMRKATETELRALVELIRRQRDKGTASVSEDEWIKATNGRYTKLAGKNVAHFAGKSQDGDFDAGGDGNRRQWWTFHIQALRSAQANKMDEAMQNNAFADHFLTDAFSAGHMINKSAIMDRAKTALNASATLRAFEVQVARGILADPLGATLGNFEANPGAFSRWTAMTEQSLADVIDRIRYWKGDYFYSTFVKAVHDKLNTDITGPDGGVEVENLKGKKWRLAGDKTLAASPQTLEFGREAVAQSRANLKQAEGQKQIDLKKLADQVWAWVPRPTKDGQKQIDDATATLTDPANAASVKAWVAIVVEPQSFQAVQTELLKEGLIRPRTGAGATAVPMPPQPAPATAAPPAAPPAPAPADPAPAAPTTVTVAVNDSLWKIAKARLGAGASDVEIDAYSRRLYEANRALIGDDPDIIMPGVVLQLPPLGS
jgi:nucleoid-associated protein YgaU